MLRTISETVTSAGWSISLFRGLVSWRGPNQGRAREAPICSDQVPKHVGLALVVRSGPRQTRSREPVDDEYGIPDRLSSAGRGCATISRSPRRETVRARCRRTCRRRAAGKDEGSQRLELAVERVEDLDLEPLDLRIAHRQPVRRASLLWSGSRSSAPRSNRSFWMRASIVRRRSELPVSNTGKADMAGHSS